MKLLILNGSPRVKGNTKAAVEFFKNNISEHLTDVEIEEIFLTEKDIEPCHNCNACQKNGGSCVVDKVTTDIISSVEAADFVLFASPVYWWGVTAQLKLAVDKLYSKCSALASCKKKIGVIAVGGAGLEDKQYRLIREQFECIADYLKWELAFVKSFSAYEPGDIEKGGVLESELSDVYKLI